LIFFTAVYIEDLLKAGNMSNSYIPMESKTSRYRWNIAKVDAKHQSSKEKFEDTKGVIIIRISKKNRQHNDQKKKDKQRSTKHTHKTKDRVTRTPLNTGLNAGAPEGYAVPASLVAPVMLI
jgi:hypothetical protein